MREALFRAAQLGGTFASEELVGQYQDRRLSRRCLDESYVVMPLNSGVPTCRAALIVWPYPAGTSDCIDRANCADDFARAHPAYRVLTDLSLSRPDFTDLRDIASDLLVFASYETIVRDITIDADGWLLLRGRRCDVVMSELLIGYLGRNGLRPVNEAWGIRTQLVNASSYGIVKSLQMEHFRRYCVGRPDVSALPHTPAADVSGLVKALDAQLGEGPGVVVRPYGASQGTGVMFVDAAAVRRNGLEDTAQQVIFEMSVALRGKYGGGEPFPVTVSPFIESMRLEGCLSDLRIFVVYDAYDGGLRAVPGMVRRAQVPAAGRTTLSADWAMTNLNAPPAAHARLGDRIFPLTTPTTLAQLGLGTNDVVQLCVHASALWATAFAAEDHLFAGVPHRQFCYGSVDFVIRPSDGVAVPIEMNGANVGSHPTVHPDFTELFARATTAALVNLGLQR